MKEEIPEDFDTKRLENLPQLSHAEAAWMAGITPDSFERFLKATNLEHLRNIPVTELVRSGFTLLGQREAQLAMFRMQLATALHREKELTELLHAKLLDGSTEHFMPHKEPKAVEVPATAPKPKPSDKKAKKSKKK